MLSYSILISFILSLNLARRLYLRWCIKIFNKAPEILRSKLQKKMLKLKKNIWSKKIAKKLGGESTFAQEMGDAKHTNQ